VKINVPEEVKTIIKRLNSQGFSAYVVGGCVRDSILNKKPQDWDISSSAKPEQVKEIFYDMGVIETGIKHGTVSVIINHNPYEVTTFRCDGEYKDNRRPDTVTFVSDIDIDLSRRDFTINALACGCEDSSEVIDLFGGIEDIKNGIVRCVGEPEKRFSEDALRILRALRFASVLGFDIDNKTSIAIHKQRDLLKNISVERIMSEFKQLVCGINAVIIIREFRDVIEIFIPEITAMFEFNQNTPYHCYDVWEHTLHSVEMIEPEVDLRFTMLFHDIGKPKVYSEEILENGNTLGHFYAHAKYSEEIAAKILNRLKSDNRLLHDVRNLVRMHGDQIPLSKSGIKRKLNKIGVELFRKLLKVKRADVLAQSPGLADERIKALKDIEILFDEIISEEECFKIKDLKINGKDLIELGFSGCEIGQTLKIILDAVVDGKIDNDRDKILEFIKMI